MSKIANYLQAHLSGEVSSDSVVRQKLAHDQSILEITPKLATYPYNVNDVRKITRFTWQLAEKGHVMALTPRGGGTSKTGAAIGDGAIVSLSAHFADILEVDTKQKLARVQPGLGLDTLQATMKTHGLTFPVTSEPDADSTIGGYIANNVAASRAVKYGDTRQWVDQLEVVLANGEVIQTGRVSKRELNKKKGLASLEGEIYRQLDGLITDQAELIVNNLAGRASFSNAGYDLADVKRDDGSFDLTPLFVGSQGTLGIITEMIIRLEEYRPQTTTMVVGCLAIADAKDALEAIIKAKPSRLEFVDQASLELAQSNHVASINEFLDEENLLPAAMLFIEFNDGGHKAKRKAKKLAKALDKADGYTIFYDDDYELQANWWQTLRQVHIALASAPSGEHHAVPIIEDASVPRDMFERYLNSIHDLAKKHHTNLVVWGSLGSGIMHTRPQLDLKRLGDRQKVFKLAENYYEMVAGLGGSIAAGYGEGRLRAGYLEKQYSQEVIELFKSTKNIFDPYNMLNPGVKVGEDSKKLVDKLRDSYDGGAGSQLTTW